MTQTSAELSTHLTNGLEILPGVIAEPSTTNINIHRPLSDARKPLKKRILSQYQGLRPSKQFRHATAVFHDTIPEEELMARLALGQFENIVVLTGAGISTAAGVPDFRSPDIGLFSRLRAQFGHRFPGVTENPEVLLSRSFFNEHPDEWRNEVWPAAQLDLDGIAPTDTHRFCAWLEQQGWLKRIYTQNIDGLHTHPSLLEQVPSLRNKVVECHGSLEKGDLVLYEDDLPDAFYTACEEDFAPTAANPADLLMVFGTSLQVTPFCAVPNLAPKGCVRVLVNRRLDECLQCPRSRRGDGGWTMPLGTHKAVSIKPMWATKAGHRRWRQLLVEGDCDDFCHAFFVSKHSRMLEHSLQKIGRPLAPSPLSPQSVKTTTTTAS